MIQCWLICRGCDRASEACVLDFQTCGPVWICLVSVWHVPVRCTLGSCWIAVCFCWSTWPHIWAICLCETEGSDETHGMQKCCDCSCIPENRHAGWEGYVTVRAEILVNYMMEKSLLYVFIYSLETTVSVIISSCSDHPSLTEGSSKPLKNRFTPHRSQPRATSHVVKSIMLSNLSNLSLFDFILRSVWQSRAKPPIAPTPNHIWKSASHIWGCVDTGNIALKQQTSLNYVLWANKQ